jgi:hypothetical protein
MATNPIGIPLTQRTAAELIAQLRGLEAMIRAHNARGISRMSYLELIVSNQLEREANALRAELDNRTSTASI